MPWVVVITGSLNLTPHARRCCAARNPHAALTQLPCRLSASFTPPHRLHTATTPQQHSGVAALTPLHAALMLPLRSCTLLSRRPHTVPTQAEPLLYAAPRRPEQQQSRRNTAFTQLHAALTQLSGCSHVTAHHCTLSPRPLPGLLHFALHTSQLRLNAAPASLACCCTKPSRRPSAAARRPHAVPAPHISRPQAMRFHCFLRGDQG